MRYTIMKEFKEMLIRGSRRVILIFCFSTVELIQIEFIFINIKHYI